MRKKNKKRVARRRRSNRRGNPGVEELVILGLNPHRGKKYVRNSASGDAAALYKKFHGRDPKEILELQESAAMRSDYTALGDLDYVVFWPDGQKEACKIEFTDSDKVKLASNPEGTQIYFIGGNQNLAQCLDQFPGDHSKDLIDLGEVLRVSYLARKEFDGYQPVYYFHDLGEEGGARPRAFYNKLQKRIFLVGGDYKVEAPGIVN